MSKRTMELKKDKEFISLLGKLTDQEITEKYGVNLCFVRKVRQDLGIKAKRIHKYPLGIEQYAGKMPDKMASEKLGCSTTTVFTYRLENKIERFKKNGSYKNADKFIKDYEELGTLQKVANKHGCTREWIRQVLQHAGYTKRFYNFTERS